MLHNGNKQDPCLLQTLHKQDWRKGFFWAIADAEATARKELLFCNGGASFHKPDYFSVVIAENRPLAVKKKKKPLLLSRLHCGAGTPLFLPITLGRVAVLLLSLRFSDSLFSFE